MKYRLVPEDELLELLRDSHKLNCLDWDGVDNWSWYLHSFDEYIATHLKETKQHKNRPLKERSINYTNNSFSFLPLRAFFSMAFAPASATGLISLA